MARSVGPSVQGWLVRAAPIVLLVLLSACSTRRVAELVLVGGHFAESRDLPYLGPARPRADVYTPRWLDGPAPVVVYLYGGRWQAGSKGEYRLLADQLTRRGIVVVVPDYTLYPDTIFPGWVEEGARAIAWTRDHVAEYGGDPARIFVVGHSAGAHTATLLALDDRYLRAAGVDPGLVRGTVSIAGPVFTEWTDEDVQALMGPPAAWPASYPRTHVDASDGPILFLHGAGDETVSPRNSTRLAALIRESGGCARAIVYPGIGHVEIVIALMGPWLGRAPVRDDIVDFVADPGSCARPDVLNDDG